MLPTRQQDQIRRFYYRLSQDFLGNSAKPHSGLSGFAAVHESGQTIQVPRGFTTEFLVNPAFGRQDVEVDHMQQDDNGAGTPGQVIDDFEDLGREVPEVDWHEYSRWPHPVVG
jgi:hypothetical protein